MAIKFNTNLKIKDKIKVSKDSVGDGYITKIANKDLSVIIIDPYDLFLDNDKNIYIVGAHQRSGYNGTGLIVKYNPSGIVLWARDINFYGLFTSISISSISPNYLYVCGYTQYPTTIPAYFVINKENGAIVNQKYFDYSEGSLITGVGIGSTGNVYTTGYVTRYNTVGGSDIFVCKNELEWQKYIRSTTGQLTEGRKIAIYSSNNNDNVYVAGYYQELPSGKPYGVLLKYDSTGTLQWQRSLSGTDFSGIAVSSSEDIYTCGTLVFGPILIAKYNSSGTLQWKQILSVNSTGQGKTICVDNSNNIYVLGVCTKSSETLNIVIAKLNSSGIVQWVRTLETNGTNISTVPRSIKTDNSYVYITAETGATNSSGANGIFSLIKLSVDGTGIGTYIGVGIGSYSTYTYGTPSYATTTTNPYAPLVSVASTLTENTLGFTTTTPSNSSIINEIYYTQTSIP